MDDALTEAPDPSVEIRIVGARTPPPAVGPRLLAAAPVAVLGIAALLGADRFRHGEAVLAARLLDQVFSRPAMVPSAGPLLSYETTAGGVPVWAAVLVTGPVSASWWVGGALLAVALMLALWRRAPAAGLLVAGMTTVAVLGVVGTARTVLVVEATARWGDTGFAWMMHTVGGPALMASTLCLCALLFTPAGLLGVARPTGDA
ncbi:hypothetical protein ACIG47_14260 [Promicromonospora sp. NPDC052451]|uniref:hypothetical protein n=1 Tax=Promicromonospora sp. NPDC052451 TaxID=3364407 RepID=UPI0037C98245